jgi:hypothetical protein
MRWKGRATGTGKSECAAVGMLIRGLCSSAFRLEELKIVPWGLSTGTPSMSK